MNSEEFYQEIKQLSEQIEGLDNKDVLFMALSNMNRNFINYITAAGAGPVPAPAPVHVQTIACNVCGNTMTVK